MEFLRVAVTAPLTNLGPVGMFVAVILWVVALFYGVRYGYGARKPGTIYSLAFLVSIIMVAGLVLMLFTKEFDNQNGVVFQVFGLLQLLTFGSVGGFVLLMALSIGFLFGVFIRILEALTAKTMR